MQITRGNTKYLKFQRHYCDDEVITELPQNIYFSIKYDYNQDEFLIQKTLNNGIEYDTKDNYYYITINPDDTEDLPYGKYYFDIKVVDNDYKNTIACDELEITERVTSANNEV